MDAVRSVQLVALAFVVQSTLWLLSSALPPLDDVDEDATSWFLGEWCDGASKDVGVAVLRGLVQASDLSMVSDQHSLLDRVAVECQPFCDQAWAMLSTVTSSPASSWLSLPRLPDALVKVVHTWVHTFETTYVVLETTS
ncbi:hypothetical protein DYB38_006617 [Aphanomyces astaci]|uniref:Uncharacterized protein n=1 Tax=Aphanomyces astaci TaxID=112090 RepID=A0A397CVV0_APHAT|nr:hypothetical protein DYB38_006617 [Aphanomyces astaci]